MLFRFIRHIYPKRGQSATAAAALIVVAAWILSLVVADLPLAGTMRAGQLHRVIKVINAKSFVLENGETVRLASLQAPNIQETSGRRRPGEPLGDESRQFLAKMLRDTQVRLELLPSPRDRKGRLIAQTYLADDTWVQGRLLAAGMAMVYPFPDSGARISDMLALEAQARKNKTGIWNNPYYAVISNTMAADYPDRFKLVEGVVRQVAQRHGNWYLNFGEDWKKDFTAFISKEDSKYFKDINLPALKGKLVRVRGWIYLHNGPAIDLTAPAQLEIVE